MFAGFSRKTPSYKDKAQQDIKQKRMIQMTIGSKACHLNINHKFKSSQATFGKIQYVPSIYCTQISRHQTNRFTQTVYSKNEDAEV